MDFFEVYTIATDLISYFERKQVKILSEANFIRNVEQKLGIRLSKEGRKKIIVDLSNEGKIKIIEGRNGKEMIAIGNLI